MSSATSYTTETMEETLPNPFNQVLDPPPPLQITTANTALLVVDMQYFDAHPDWGEGRTAQELGVADRFDPYFAQIDATIPRIQDLLALFRGKDMEVIHLRVAEVTADSRDVGWKQLVRGLVVPANSREADPLDEVAPIGDELVVSKSSSGVFPVTNFDRLLRNMGITTLIMTGTSTGGCVESAVRDAVDLGYDVVVVADACADATPADHQQALGRMVGGLTRVMTTAEVADLIGNLPPGDRQARSGVERVKSYLPGPPTTEPDADVNPYALIFPPAIDLAWSPQNSALLLVDAQRLTCDATCGLGLIARQRGVVEILADYYDRVVQALRGMQVLLIASRAATLPVIHVRTAGHLPDGRDLSRKTRSQGLQIGLQSPEAEFMPQVEPGPEDIVLSKGGSGAFTGTELDQLLRNLGIEHLILGGISYDGAVESTIRSAGDRGYGVVLVPDACATFHPELQEELWRMESGTIRVTRVDDIVDRLAAS